MPVVNIEDAFLVGEERCAVYVNCKVTIYLFKGTHYIVRDRGNRVFMPISYIDSWSQTMEVIVKPLSQDETDLVPTNMKQFITTEKVTLNNKLGAYLSFKVNKFLHMQDIIINSVDSTVSILEPEAGLCLNQRKQCCQQNTKNVFSKIIPGSFQCQPLPTPTEVCKYSYPLPSLFQTGLNPSMMLETSPTLILERVDLKNIFYELNSVVHIGRHGARVTLKSCNISQVAMCGGVIKNYFDIPDSPIKIDGNAQSEYVHFSSQLAITLTQTYLTNFERDIPETVNPYKDCTQTLVCSFLEIKASFFTNLHAMKTLQTSYQQVTRNQFQGLILNLDSFKGDVHFKENQVMLNYVMYDGCITLDTSKMTKLKDLIIIRKAPRLVMIADNKFNNNVGMRGIGFIESTAQLEYPVVVYMNQFTQNTGYFESSGLIIRKLAINVLTADSHNDQNLLCGGVYVFQNSFDSNVGCVDQVKGPLIIECVDQNKFIQTDQLKTQDFYYQPQTDQMTLVKTYEMPLEQKKEFLKLDKSLLTQKIYSFSNKGDHKVVFDMKYLSLISNEFITNFAGKDGAIIIVRHFPYILIQDGKFVANGNLIADVVEKYSDLNLYGQNFTSITDNMLRNKALSRQTLDNYAYKAKGMIYIQYTVFTNFLGIDFIGNNWIIESKNSASKQAQIIMFEGLLGRFIVGKLYEKIPRIGQVEGINTIPILLFFGLTLADGNLAPGPGVMANLFTFDKSVVKEFVMDTVNMDNIIGYKHPQMKFHLFDVDQRPANIDNTGYSITISSLAFLNILINNGDVPYRFKTPKFVSRNMTYHQFSNVLIDNTFTSIVELDIGEEDVYELTDITITQNTGITLAPIRVISTLPSKVQTSSKQLNLKITNLKIHNNHASQVGAISLSLLPSMKVHILNSEFNQNQGGTVHEILIQQVKEVRLIGANFKQIFNGKGTQANAILKKSDSTLYLEDSLFNCGYQGVTQEDLDYIVAKKFKQAAYSSLISIANSRRNYFKNNSYTNCKAADAGAVFALEQGSRLVDIQSVYRDNSAIRGGLFYIKSSELSLTNATIERMVANEGSVGVAEQGSLFEIKGTDVFGRVSRSTIENNVALGFATINILAGSSFKISNTVFRNNRAIKHTSIIYSVSSSEETRSLINNCEIYGNQVDSGASTLTLFFSSVDITNTKFRDNYAALRNDNIFCINTDILIKNVSMADTPYKNQTKSLNSKKGTFVYISSGTKIKIEESSFTNGDATKGGALFVIGDAEVEVIGSTFLGNKADQGGAIHATDFKSFKIGGGTLFRDQVSNQAQGEVIVATNSDNTLEFDGARIENVKQNAITLNKIGVKINRLVIIGHPDSVGYTHNFVGGILLEAVSSFTITNSELRDLVGLQGGAIAITIPQSVKQISSESLVFSIHSIIIHNCKSIKNGGGLYLSYMRQISLNNVTITNNQALGGNGGGIWFNCIQQEKDVCILKLENSLISENRALIGGGINWNYREPIQGPNVKVVQNIGRDYGANYASFSRALVVITEQEYTNNRIDSRRQLTILNQQPALELSYSNLVSGNPIKPTYMALVDKYNQIVSTDSQSKIIIAMNQSIKLDPNLRFTPALGGVTTIYCTNGLFNLSGIIYTAAPGSNQTLVLSTDGISLFIPDNRQYVDLTWPHNNYKLYTLKFKVFLRLCTVGEGLKETGACFTCPKGSYKIDPPFQPQECDDCPGERALCLGGTSVGPAPGYWRKSNITKRFILCQIPSSCLGMKLPNINPTGDCREGYYGPLCTVCMPGYARSGDFGCSLCPNMVLNGLRILGIFVAAIVVVIMLVRSTISGATKDNAHSVYMKIFMNHLQMMTLASTFNMKWPETVTGLLGATKPVSQPANQLFSFDCFLDNGNTDQINPHQLNADPNEIRLIYQKLFIICALPVILVATCWIIWVLILKCKREIHLLEEKFSTTIVIVLFLVHPSVTQTILDMFNCQQFDKDNRLMKDLLVLCYTNMHFNIAIFVALPFLVIWGFGIPLLAYFMLKAVKEKLDLVATKKRFGFLYNGFKNHSYYWEVIIMYRKICMILCGVFLRNIGVMVQALVVLILLILFLQTHSSKKPFKKRGLNDVEAISLITTTLTIYCGLFFISAKDPKSINYDPNVDYFLNEPAKLFFFFVILGGNVIFIIVWMVNFYLIMRLQIRDKFPKLYLWVCFCCRKDLFNRERQKSLEDIKREEIINKIEDVAQFFLRVRQKYILKLKFGGHNDFMSLIKYIEYARENIDMGEVNLKKKSNPGNIKRANPEAIERAINPFLCSVDDNKLDHTSQHSNSQYMDDTKVNDETIDQIYKTTPQQTAKGLGKSPQKMYNDLMMHRSSCVGDPNFDQSGIDDAKLSALLSKSPSKLPKFDPQFESQDESIDLSNINGALPKGLFNRAQLEKKMGQLKLKKGKSTAIGAFMPIYDRSKLFKRNQLKGRLSRNQKGELGLGHKLREIQKQFSQDLKCTSESDLTRTLDESQAGFNETRNPLKSSNQADRTPTLIDVPSEEAPPTKDELKALDYVMKPIMGFLETLNKADEEYKQMERSESQSKGINRRFTNEITISPFEGKDSHQSESGDEADQAQLAGPLSMLSLRSKHVQKLQASKYKKEAEKKEKEKKLLKYQRPQSFRRQNARVSDKTALNNKERSKSVVTQSDIIGIGGSKGGLMKAKSLRQNKVSGGITRVQAFDKLQMSFPALEEQINSEKEQSSSPKTPSHDHINIPHDLRSYSPESMQVGQHELVNSFSMSTVKRKKRRRKEEKKLRKSNPYGFLNVQISQ